MQAHTLGAERLPPLETGQLNPAQRAEADRIRSSGARAFLQGSGAQRLGGNLDMFLRRPELLRATLEVSDALRDRAMLSPRQKELAILCIARHYRGDYAWFQHEPLALSAGLPQAVIDAIREDLAPQGLDPRESALFAFVQEWMRTEDVSDGAFAAALSALGEECLVELVVIVGYYRMGVTTLKVGRVPLPDGALSPWRD